MCLKHFSSLFLLEEKMNLICDNMGDATPEELDAMMTRLRVKCGIYSFPMIYVSIQKWEWARALGLTIIGLERGVTTNCPVTRGLRSCSATASGKTRYSIARRASQLPGRIPYRIAELLLK